MIKIFDTWVDETRIIGAGPLCEKNRYRVVSAPPEICIYFELYLEDYPITITTGWVEIDLAYRNEYYNAEHACMEAVHDNLFANFDLRLPTKHGFDTENTIL